MTPALFTRAGIALFGHQYREQFAIALGCSVKSVQRYADGVRSVPAEVAERIAGLIWARRGELAEIGRAIR